MPDMDCRKAESMINRYIRHQLSIDDLEDFLYHIERCPSCYEELQTYFIVHEAVQQLDEDTDTDLDFRKLLQTDIHKSYRYVRRKKIAGIVYGIAVLLAVAAVAIMILIAMQMR